MFFLPKCADGRITFGAYLNKLMDDYDFTSTNMLNRNREYSYLDGNNEFAFSFPCEINVSEFSTTQTFTDVEVF